MDHQTEPVTMWFDRRIVMRASPIHGTGVFATHAIRAGERLIWVSGGIVYTSEDWRTGKVQLAAEQYNEYQVGDDLFLATPKALYYLNLAPINDHLRWREELLEGLSQPSRHRRQLVKHYPGQMPMLITFDKPADMPDIAHQTQQPVALKRRQQRRQPPARPDQYVMRQGVQQHHDLLRLEALLVPLCDAQPLLVVLESCL